MNRKKGSGLRKHNYKAETHINISESIYIPGVEKSLITERK